jgi:hypothetical protein
MAIGDLAKQIQESSDSRLRERLREVDPMSPAWSGIIAELEYRASNKMRASRQHMWRDLQRVKSSNQAMQRTAGRSAFPLSMTSTFNQQPHSTLASGR